MKKYRVYNVEFRPDGSLKRCGESDDTAAVGRSWREVDGAYGAVVQAKDEQGAVEKVKHMRYQIPVRLET
jgi:hypothetical protein